MKYTFEIPDDLIPSVELYLNANVTTSRDELTGSTRVERNPGHESPESLMNHHLNDLLHQIVQKYPTGEIREKMLAAKSLQDQVKEIAVARPAGAEIQVR